MTLHLPRRKFLLGSAVALAAPALLRRGADAATIITRGAMSAQGFGFGGGIVPSTWNPLDKTASATLSNGNKTVALTSIHAGVRGTLSHSGGKYYFEYINTTDGAQSMLGIASSAWSFSNYLGRADSVSAGYFSAGSMNVNFDTETAGSTFTSGDNISVAVDIGNTLIYWAKNGVWQNSAVPGSGTGGQNYITTDPVFPAATTNGSSGVITLVTDAASFSYSPPSGFSAWG